MSATPTLRGISQAALGVGLVAAAALLSFRSGGFYDQPRTELAIAGWLLVAGVAATAGPSSIPPPGRAGRAALAGLLGLAAWTALSLLWAPLGESAREDAVRLALYAAGLPLAVFAYRTRRAARALEAVLAALALAVVGYGLLGEIGLLDLDASVAADGRLEQPLSYWNAMGAMAALGLVLSVRLATDRTRRAVVRVAGAVAAAPIAAGLYLTYSRGALAAAVLGLVALALVAPEGDALWRRIGRRSRLAVAAAALLATFAALGAVATDRATPPERGAKAARFAEIGSNRADYWAVAAESFASAPLAGVGASGFKVEWLRERDAREGAADAHSLYLETAAELGVVGLFLLGGFVAGVAACAVGVRRSDPALAAGPLAALTVLAFHAGIDWDWELPALALPGLYLAGAVMARDARAAVTDRPPARRAG